MKTRILFLLFTVLIFVSSVYIAQNGYAQTLNSADSTRFSIPHDFYNDLKVNKEITDPKLYFPYANPLYTNTNITNNPAPQNEPSVRISRKNPNRVVAAWRDFRYGIDPVANRRVGYSYSSDGGTTWSVPVILDSTLIPGKLRNSDAVVGVDSAGNFYIGVIALDGSSILAVYKSTDGGVTFPFAYTVATSSGTGEDKEYITTDLTPGSPYYNTIYFSWTRFVAGQHILCVKSTNGGVNWSAPVNVSEATSGVQGSDPVVSANGQVNIVWVRYSGSTAIINFDKSTDGGNTFGTDIAIASGVNPTTLPNNVVTFPSIAADISGGPRHGYLYTVFCDSRNGDPDVFLCRSTNAGDNWSAPVRINNDPVGNGKLQYWPWIGVNNQGNIAIIWMDTRNTANNNIIEAYMARSTDGGLTFTNELLSSQPSPTNVPGTNVRFGDYVCIDYWNNRIVPVWTDERAGGYDMEIYSAVINLTVGINPISNKIPDGFKLNQNYPNPFNPTTSIKFDIPVNSQVSLKIFDMLGKEVAELVNGNLKAGSYSVNWDASGYSSGVYFYKMQTADFSDVKRMLLIK